MKILGIDPSLSCSGWAIVEKNHNSSFSYVSSGVVKTNSKESIYNRLAKIKNDFDSVYKAFSPDKIIIEMGFVMANQASSLKLAVARGVIIASTTDYILQNFYAEKINYDSFIFEVTPTFVKKSITGSGVADKIQLDKMIRLIIQNIPNQAFQSSDESDAIAIAISLN